MAKTTVPQYLSATTSIIDSGDATAITIDGSENVAIGGGTNHDGAALLISHGDSGVTTFSDNADELVIENSTNAGISILTPSNASGSIIFGDSDDDDIGKIVYNHNDNSLTLTATTVATSGNATVGGTLGVTGAVTANAGVVVDNITIDGTEIDLSSGNLTIDVAGHIYLDTDSGNVIFNDAGTTWGQFFNTNSNFYIQSGVQDKDIIFRGNDGGSTVTALTLDMSAAGAATFNSSITIPDYVIHDGNTATKFGFGSANTMNFISNGSDRLTIANSYSVFNEAGSDYDFRVESNNNTHMLFVDGGNDRVGIGTSSPAVPLDVRGNVNVTADDARLLVEEADGTNIGWFGDITGAGVGGCFLYNHGGTATVQIRADATAGFINNGANFGIGTSSPAGALDVVSTGYGSWVFYVRRSANGAQLAGIYESSSGDGGHGMFYLMDGGGTTDVKLSTNGDSWFNGGDVGIGTTSPSAKLHIDFGNDENLWFYNAGVSGDTRIISINDAEATTQALTLQADPLIFKGTGGTERLRITSDGDVLIGQTAQTGYAFGEKLVVGDGDANDGITIQSGSTHQGNLAFNHSDGTTAYGRILYQHNTNYMAFFTNNAEKMRIDTSGNLLVGTTTDPLTLLGASSGTGLGFKSADGYLTLARDTGSAALYINKTTTADGDIVLFRKQGSTVGSITYTSSATAYNTSSDARLKDVTGEARGLEVINALNPVAFNWKANNAEDEGLLAQEVMEIVPNAVSQSEDEYYQMDYSKLVTPLIKALQEADDNIEELEARITTLEG